MFRLLVPGLTLAILVLTPTTTSAATVAWVGDSHSQALCPRIGPVLVESGHEFTCTARPGWSTASFIRNRGWLQTITSDTDVVVVSLGGNNHRPVALYKQDLDRMVLLLRQRSPGAFIVWYGPAFATRQDVLHRHITTVTYQEGLLPFMGVQWFSTVNMTSDLRLRRGGVHFNTESYNIWSHRLLNHLADLLDD